MLSHLKIKDLEKQGYRLVGKNSAIKVCDWCKKAIRGENICYKGDFYGIQSWQCIQMTPTFCCSHRCIFCWRNIEETSTKHEHIDDPKEIVENCIKEHIKYLQGFGGNKECNKKRFEQAIRPLHFAISLTGEPTLYPKLPELIAEIKSRKMTAFIVTNGTNPEMLKQLLNNQPTQLYLTLPAPDKETYLKTCNPLQDSWEKIQESLSLLKKFKRSCIRLTLVKDVNMINPKAYAELIQDANPNFVELKAYMHVGHSKERLEIKNMPRHHEIKEFAEKVAKESGWKIIDEKPESRVILLMKKDSQDRILHFN